ncbi:Mitochondrial Carrier (MC) Family [Phytophthora cinnamomi]|uniref:Mitochondrial Carrier (MC) Family n=1 Tax=Phytophthora cinnamomi TaxID=4785 RepID=UPI00355A3444|nr:Mitochondrial Carrier (MC) Family [Phytophthora cinnamomi]
MAAASSMTVAKLAEDQRHVDELSGASRKTKKLLAGALSGMISALAFQPLDVLRTHQQGAFTAHAEAPKAASRLSLPETIKASRPADDPVARLRSMWRGTSPTLVRVAGGAGLYFATLDHCLNLFPQSAVNTFLAGAFARTFAGGVMSPFTIVKARMEFLPPGTFDSNLHVVRHVLHHEGVRGLYRGMVPTLIRDVPFSGLYVLIYTRLRDSWTDKFSHLPVYGVHFSSGVVAGVLATSIVHPADVVKTRMQLAIMVNKGEGSTASVQNSLTLRQTVAKIFRHEGIRGFAKGIIPRVVKRTLSTAVTWTIYEQLSLR